MRSPQSHWRKQAAGDPPRESDLVLLRELVASTANVKGAVGIVEPEGLPHQNAVEGCRKAVAAVAPVRTSMLERRMPSAEGLLPARSTARRSSPGQWRVRRPRSVLPDPGKLVTSRTG